VLAAMTRYATEGCASSGRGAYAEAIESGRLIAKCRARLNTLVQRRRSEPLRLHAQLLGRAEPRDQGLILHRPPGHAICTHVDHNSVLRPLNALADANAVERRASRSIPDAV
jgi:selenocysteine lyase/cysteine desulfurase